MKPVLSPKELAEAIGASESSLKRWIDQGVIKSGRTAGGHRRIAIQDAIDYIRNSRTPIIRPEVLGLTDMTAETADIHSESQEQFTNYLLHGDAERARGWLLSRYFQGMSVAELGDGPIHKAMSHLGSLWTHDPAGIFYEHRASDICIQSINRIRTILPNVPNGAIAVGGGPEHDPYLIPSALAGAVLHECGFNAVNLGAFTPIDTILASVRELKPRVVWWSISAESDLRPLAGDIEKMADAMAPLGTRLIVGGRIGHQVPLARRPNVRIGDNMNDLSELACAEHWIDGD